MVATPTYHDTAPKARFFRGFSDPSRLRIMEALVDRPRSVSEIAEVTGLSQPNTSNHLACLLGCGLVEREQRGRFAFYRPSDPRVSMLLSIAEDLVAGSAGRLAACPHCGSGARE
jgi:DNA-binding transcriptional ArsR family regulator